MRSPHYRFWACSLLLAALLTVTSGCTDLVGKMGLTLDEDEELIGPEGLGLAPLDAQQSWVLIHAGRFYATGGPDSNHAYKGVDAYLPTFLARSDPIDRCPYRNVARRSTAAEFVQLWLWHTGDWVAFHVPDPGWPYIIEICMGDGGSKPAYSRPVTVWRDPDLTDLDRANGHDEAASGTWLCEIEVTHSGKPRIEKSKYICDSPSITGEHMIVIELEDGEFSEYPRDRNLLIDWIKLSPTAGPAT